MDVKTVPGRELFPTMDHGREYSYLYVICSGLRKKKGNCNMDWNCGPSRVAGMYIYIYMCNMYYMAMIHCKLKLRFALPTIKTSHQAKGL